MRLEIEKLKLRLELEKLKIAIARFMSWNIHSFEHFTNEALHNSRDIIQSLQNRLNDLNLFIRSVRVQIAGRKQS